MQQRSDIIPLFPLDLVVFPGHLVPLHIFEDRYKRMIADCGESSGPFGINLQRQGEVADVGCAVQVVRRGKAAPDGSFDIVCQAQWRYRVVEVVEESPYLRARIDAFEDDDADADLALRELVAKRFQTLAELAAEEAGTQIVDGGQVQEASPTQAAEIVSWDVAQRLGLELPQRQLLLEMRSEDGRLQHLAEMLEELLPILEGRRARKRRVRSNGHHH